MRSSARRHLSDAVLTEAQITSARWPTRSAGNAVVSTPTARGGIADRRTRQAGAVPRCQGHRRRRGELLRDEPLRHSMRKNAYKLGRDMVWSRVAQLYAKSFEQARLDHSFVGRRSSPIKTLDEQPGQLPEMKLEHLFRMSDSTGIFQHASFTVPNFAEGYARTTTRARWCWR